MKMAMRIRMIITALMLMVSMGMDAQIKVGYQTDSAKIAEYHEAIGLDMNMPDYSIKKIDESKIGHRLANILRYLEDNIDQGQYNHWMASVYREQNESHKNVYFVIKKIKLQSITKSGNDIDICYKIWPDENPVQIKQAVISLHFKDVVSESKATNEMFSNISHYVQTREKLRK